MSEQLARTHESGHDAEPLLEAGHVEKLLEATTERSPAELQAEALKQVASAEQARATVETTEQDNPLARLEASEAAAAAQAPIAPPNTFLRKQTLTRELQTIQRKESAPDRALSKVIHQPAIRAISETAGKTISRPSGLLGGGIMAFIGTTGYLYLAKHIGFNYQSSVFLVLLVAGFGLGLALEALLRLFTSRRA